MKACLDYLRADEGASAAEYALMLAIIGAAVAAAFLLLGNSISAATDKYANCLANHPQCPS